MSILFTLSRDRFDGLVGASLSHGAVASEIMHAAQNHQPTARGLAQVCGVVWCADGFWRSSKGSDAGAVFSPEEVDWKIRCVLLQAAMLVELVPEGLGTVEGVAMALEKLMEDGDHQARLLLAGLAGQSLRIHLACLDAILRRITYFRGSGAHRIPPMATKDEPWHGLVAPWVCKSCGMTFEPSYGEHHRCPDCLAGEHSAAEGATGVE
jgi:hypothetical protein